MLRLILRCELVFVYCDIYIALHGKGDMNVALRLHNIHFN